ncbi:transposase [Pseudoduganella namucuonensis]|uniref:REP element-mobilizing transposase RayT n=1 Tax=Pseudoduganella namucuonensis TaxID=1035707 RepID=A0A1I7JFR4_9BURK|nr:transposase [Pseudoduganella namucuonensis]SFU84028.1 REP element-mobilizing transposase RayT [Pseudoduganella namucuonensis]
MNRPLRVQFPGAIYHITARGNRRVQIYMDERDRLVWLSILGKVVTRHNGVVYCYCQMGNHYHLVVETPDANLPLIMQMLNGEYSQYFNHRHGLIGHLFQARYHAVLLRKDEQMMEVVRYTVLNPVRARLVKHAGDWIWSSHQANIQRVDAPEWLDTVWVLSRFDGEPARAIVAYERFVAQGVDMANPMLAMEHDLMLGHIDIATLCGDNPPPLEFISKAQRSAFALPLAEYESRYAVRGEAIARAFASRAYTMQQIARHFKCSAKTVSRAVRKYGLGDGN